MSDKNERFVEACRTYFEPVLARFGFLPEAMFTNDVAWYAIYRREDVGCALVTPSHGFPRTRLEFGWPVLDPIRNDRDWIGVPHRVGLDSLCSGRQTPGPYDILVEGRTWASLSREDEIVAIARFFQDFSTRFKGPWTPSI